MKLRDYKRSDSKIITSWIKDEESLYKWSADRICKFPLEGDELNAEYDGVPSGMPIYPLTAVDAKDNVIGHILIRFPDESRKNARLGFVIVSPDLRGKGQGQVLVRLALQYIGDNFDVDRVTLGVFAKNTSALNCYKACGFVQSGGILSYEMPIGTWDLIEMEKAP